MKVEPDQLKAFLLERGLISEEKFNEIRKTAEELGRKIDDLLVENNLISAKELIKLKAYILGLPFVDLQREEVSADVLNLVPEQIARNYRIVPYKKEGANIEIAAVEPESFQAVDYLGKTASLTVLYRLTTPASIENILKQYSFRKGEKEGITGESPDLEETDLERLAQDHSVAKVINSLFRTAVNQKISEIQIIVRRREALVRYQTEEGKFKEIMTVPKKFSQGLVARIKLFANLKLREKMFQEGYFTIKKDKGRHLIKVSVFPMMNEEKIVIKILSSSLKEITSK